MSSGGTGGGGGGGGQGPGGAGVAQENPIAKWYKEWSARTPLVTRRTMQMILILWILTWFVDLSYKVVNIPYYTIMQYEVYRLLLAPIYTEGFLSVLFICMTLSGMGTTLENAMGSTGLMTLMATLAFLTNILFLVICFILYACGVPEALFYMAGSFWLIVLGLLTVDCLQGPAPTRQLFMLPVAIPSKFFPILLWALFSLFTGPRLDMGCAVVVGYVYGYGFLNIFKPSERTLERWEASSLLSGVVNKPGYISQAYARGSQAWTAMGGDPGAGGGGGGRGSILPSFAMPGSGTGMPSSGGNALGRGPPVGANPSTIYNSGTHPASATAAASTPAPAFQGSGQTLGSISVAAPKPPPNSREAAEARAAKFSGAHPANDNEEETANLLRR